MGNRPSCELDLYGLNAGVGTIGVAGLTSDDLAVLSGAGIAVKTACEKPPKKKCIKTGERGHDGTLPHNSITCTYICSGKEGFKIVGAGEKCPDNPLESDVELY